MRAVTTNAEPSECEKNRYLILNWSQKFWTSETLFFKFDQ